MVYQNALLYRDSNKQQPIMPKRNPNVKMFDESSDEYPSHLEFEDHYQRAYTQRDRQSKALTHEREYL
jgi:hypothetical protein